MKILLTGKNGMLGQEFMKLFERTDYEILALGSDELDITDREATLKKVEDFDPEFIINCAANSDVDGAEKDSGPAFAVNDLGTENLAIAAQKNESILIHFSTDYIFDGEKEDGYYEDDLPDPINQYGLSKLAGEEKIKENLDEYYIIRTSWLYGESGKNFVKTMLWLAEQKDVIEVVDDQVGCPTYAKDLTYWVWENCLLRGVNFGIYHVTNSKHCSWFEFAKEIFSIAGKKIEVKPITSEQLGRPAKRPKVSILHSKKTAPLRGWDDALADFLG